MLTMSAYQAFSDTHLTAAARIIKTLCGGFPLACRQWGFVTYNSYPNGQLIVPLVDFKDFFAGAVVDTGIKWNAGGTFSSLSCENGNLIFWPLYSGLPYNDYAEAVSRNGTNHHWFIFVR